MKLRLTVFATILLGLPSLTAAQTVCKGESFEISIGSSNDATSKVPGLLTGPDNVSNAITCSIATGNAGAGCVHNLTDETVRIVTVDYRTGTVAFVLYDNPFPTTITSIHRTSCVRG